MPDNDTPPVETPPATPPVEKTPPATPPVEKTPATPPVEKTPPATPPVETPPVETPPADGDKTPFYQSDTMPADWREQIAGEDTAKLNMLKRIPDFGTFLNNYFEAQNTLRTKQEAVDKNPARPGEDASDEDWAKYREATGIPAEADGYAEHLSSGLELGDEDKEALKPFFEVFHNENIPGEQAARLVDAYYEMDNHEKQRVAHEDSRSAAAATQALKQAWGGDFEQNQGLIESMFRSALPADAVDAFMGGRMADGTAIFNHPGVLQAFAGMARDINPTATLVPSGENPMQTLDARRKELEGIMRNESDRWYKDSGLQSEYQQIVDAQEKLKARQGGK